jgi:hypothetical protein
MAKDNWWNRSKFERLAAVCYPHLTDDATRAEMTEVARGERKKAPAPSPLQDDRSRQHVSPLGGVAKK